MIIYLLSLKMFNFIKFTIIYKKVKEKKGNILWFILNYKILQEHELLVAAYGLSRFSIGPQTDGRSGSFTLIV